MSRVADLLLLKDMLREHNKESSPYDKLINKLAKIALKEEKKEKKEEKKEEKPRVLSTIELGVVIAGVTYVFGWVIVYGQMVAMEHIISSMKHVASGF